MDTTVALLITDIVDSTRLQAELGDAAMQPLWEHHDRAARELLRTWRGREIGRSDGFLLVFERVADAAGFADDYHRLLQALQPPWNARAGLHVGPVALRENDARAVELGATRYEVDGLALPVAARLSALAGAGQTLMSADALQALKRHGPDAEAALATSHGHWRLKGLPEPVEVFELLHGRPRQPPLEGEKGYRVVRTEEGWRTARDLPHRLPAARDAFFDRLDAQAGIASAFEEGARLVTLLGLGGIGKTRLALHYARSWLGHHPGGAWFCDLASARDADGVVRAVAAGLDVPLQNADPARQLAAALEARGSCLVILDNFEQVVRHAEATVGAWLAAAPQARFLATSREILGVRGERAMPLPPLPPGDAGALFRERMASAGAAPSAPADAQAIAPLVELLDRLPLAIELAAARTRTLSARTLLQRMGERFRLLASRSGRVDRQATLRATLDWSWDLLNPQEQTALAQLSVFQGGFDLEAAEAVVETGEQAGDQAGEAIDLLQSLVEKSLVRSLGEDRFDLLLSVQEYAAGKLRDSGGEASAQARHIAHFSGYDEARATSRRGLDHDNLVIACERAIAAGDAAGAVGTLTAAWGVLHRRGPFRRGLELAKRVRAMGLSDPRLAGRACLVEGWAARVSGQLSLAAERFDEALVLSREAGDELLQASVLTRLGDLHIVGGRTEEAEADYRSALELSLRLGDPHLECGALCGLGNARESRGDLAGARGFYERQRDRARACSLRRWEGGALGNLGTLWANEGRAGEALASYEAALAVARELGDRHWEGNTLCNLGLLQQASGRAAEARQTLDEALSLAEDLGYRRLAAVVVCNLGLLHEATGDLGAAEAAYERALAEARHLDDRRSEGQFLQCLGSLQLKRGKVAQACESLERAEGRLREVDDRLNLAIALCTRAEALWCAGERDAALHCLDEAAATGRELASFEGSELGAALSRASARLRSDEAAGTA